MAATVFTGMDLGEGMGRSAALDRIGEMLAEDGFWPVVYRMNGASLAAVSGAVFRTTAAAAAAAEAAVAAGARLGTYVDGASGGRAVRIEIDQTLPTGTVQVDAEELIDA